MARCGGRAAGQVCAHAAQRRIGNGHREGHARGHFVCTPASGGELDREGASPGHVAQMGVPVHDAYVRLGS
jgi:hypothetical protein